MQATLRTYWNRREWRQYLTSDLPPYLLLVIFASLDTFLTANALTYWNATELNPVAVWLWNSAGLYGLLGGKIVLFMLILLLDKADPHKGRVVLWVSATVQILVVTTTLAVHHAK